jgi:hypothetical protein
VSQAFHFVPVVIIGLGSTKMRRLVISAVYESDAGLLCFGLARMCQCVRLK